MWRGQHSSVSSGFLPPLWEGTSRLLCVECIIKSVCLSVNWREGSQSLKEWIILLLPPINPQLTLNPPAFQFPIEISWSHVTLVFCVFCLLCSLNAWFTFSQWCQRIAWGAFSLVSIRLSKSTSNSKKALLLDKTVDILSLRYKQHLYSMLLLLMMSTYSVK